MKPWYDMRAGIQRKLDDGLTGLRELAKERDAAGYERGERLATWVVLRRFVLDKCGNLGSILEGHPPVHADEVLTNEEMQQISPSYSWSPFRLPTTADRCTRCGGGWDLHNADDCVWSRSQPVSPTHRGCKVLAVIQDTYEQMQRIVKRAEVEVCAITLMPSRYDPETPEVYGPWVRLHTPHGCVCMGWRKRVISITWKESSLWLPTELESEDVTMWSEGIHAWSEDDAVRYLRAIFGTA